MFALSALALSAAGFATPNSRVLALRGGGISNDQLSSGLAGLYLATGLSGWIGPKKTMEGYGVKEISDEEIFFMRALNGINIVAGLTLIAAETDLAKAASVCLTAQAVVTTANLPQLEKLGVEKGPVVSCIAAFALLGELSRRGKVDADLVSNINLVFLLGSAFEIVAQKATINAFMAGTDPSPLSKSLLENFSWTKVNTGLFLLVSKLTGKRGFGLAAASASNMLNCVKTLLRADKVGLAKPGLIVWSALQAVAALLAAKNEMS
jgi:hypothetical protein